MLMLQSTASNKYSKIGISNFKAWMKQKCILNSDFLLHGLFFRNWLYKITKPA